MSAANFSPEVVHLKDTSIYGERISTSYATAALDCPALWQSFGQKVGLGQNSEGCENPGMKSYGVSIMTGPENFDYMAALEMSANAQLPAGMQEFVLPSGQYLKCVCPSLGKIGEVFTFMYEGSWVMENTPYALDFEKPCFEEYDADFLTSGVLYIYAPLKD